MQSYDDEIEKEAADFLIGQKDLMVESVIRGSDFDYNHIENLDQIWHESIVDRSYTVEDAAYILQNCENEEDGMDFSKDYRDAMSQRAAYSFSNDVWFKTVQFYDEIKERFNELMTEDENLEPTVAAIQAFEEFEKRNGPESITPVEKDSDDERQQLGEWLSLGNAIGGFWFGYPLGSAYIDSRCGSGHGMPDVKEFVDFDHETAKKVPWMAGKRKEEVQNRFDELLNEHKRLQRHDIRYVRIDKAFPQSSDVTKKNATQNCTYQDIIVDTIWNDERLSPADIRKIISMLSGKAGGY